MEQTDTAKTFPLPDGLTPSIMLTGNPDQWLRSKNSVSFSENAVEIKLDGTKGPATLAIPRQTPFYHSQREDSSDYLAHSASPDSSDDDVALRRRPKLAQRAFRTRISSWATSRLIRDGTLPAVNAKLRDLARFKGKIARKHIFDETERLGCGPAENAALFEKPQRFGNRVACGFEMPKGASETGSGSDDSDEADEEGTDGDEADEEGAAGEGKAGADGEIGILAEKAALTESVCEVKLLLMELKMARERRGVEKRGGADLKIAFLMFFVAFLFRVGE